MAISDIVQKIQNLLAGGHNLGSRSLVQGRTQTGLLSPVGPEQLVGDRVTVPQQQNIVSQPSTPTQQPTITPTPQPQQGREDIKETIARNVTQEVFGDKATEAMRVLRHEDEQGNVKGENTRFLTGPEVDISNEGYQKPSETKQAEGDVMGKDGMWYSQDRGLFRINNRTFADFKERKPALLKKAGISSYKDMYDPVKNAKMAKIIYDEQGWNAWFAAPEDLKKK